MLGSSNTAKATLPRRKHTELEFGLKTLPMSKLITNASRLAFRAMTLKWMPLLIWTLNNSEPNISSKSHQETLPSVQALKPQLPMFPVKPTGQPREQLLLLKIKVNAGHAGLSQLLVLWKVPISTKREVFFPSQSNSSLTAQNHMEIKLAMEV